MENFTIIMLNVWFCHWRFWVIRRLLRLFIKDIRVDKEDRKPALLRGRLFDMWYSTSGGTEEVGDMFLTCGSAVSPSTGCTEALCRGELSGADLFALPSGGLREETFGAEWRAFKFLALSLLWWMEMSTIGSVVFVFIEPDRCLVSHYSA